MWEHVLKRAEASKRQGFGEEKWLHIMELFLQHDVDLKGSSTNVDDTRRRILGVIEGFGANHPNEAVSLRASIGKKLPDKKRNKIKL